MENKTLIDFLKELEPNEMVYLGTTKGSGWIVIETASKIIENLDKLETMLHEDAKDTLERAIYIMNNYPLSITKTQEKIINYTGTDHREMEKLERTMDRLESAYVNAYRTRNEYRKHLANWIRLHDRKVEDIYEHQTEAVGTCIRVRGIEKGRLWFYGELKII